jgi:integrase
MACITKRRNRWVIDFYDHHGKRRWKTLKDGTTKKKAREELRAIEDMVANGSYLPSKMIPLFSEVAEDWLEYKKPKIRITTWKSYKGHTKNHFQDFDGLKINRITIATVEKFITAKQTEGMNINTLRKILVTLGQILSYAVRHRYMDHNPLRDAEKPRKQGNGSDCLKKTRILTPDQINALLSAIKSVVEEKEKDKDRDEKKVELENRLREQKYRMLFTVAIFTGARQGELLGLKWKDLDWENRQVHIQRTYNHGRFFTPKTDNSNRKIDLGPNLMNKLREWRLASPPSALDLIFPNVSGQPMDCRNMVNRYFEPALEKAELPIIRFHDLRHTFASLLIEQGENIKYIENQLGHSSPTVTLDVYAHLMKKKNPESALRVEQTIFEASGSKMVANKKKELRENP